MRRMLLGYAAGLAVLSLATPAMAGGPDIAFVGIPNAKGTVGTLGGAQVGFGHQGFGHPGFGFGGDYDRRGRGHGGSSGDLGLWVNSGQWAAYNNETFKSDSYNDWWHDNPNRAYPAWMRNNQKCEKLWYSGSTLRC